MIVDFHAHILPRAVSEVGPARLDWHGITTWLDDDGRINYSVEGVSGNLTHPSRLTVADRVRTMDEKGIDLQVLSLNPAITQYSTDAASGQAAAAEFNDEVADIVAAAPDRFAGLAHLPLQDSDVAIEELERARAKGLIGAMVHTHVSGENWDSDRLFPLLEAAEQLGAIMFFHPSQIRVRKLAPKYHLRNMIGNPWETTTAIASLIFSGALDKLPGLKTCFAHGGGFAPYVVGRFDHGARVRPENAGLAELPSSYMRSLTFDSITHSPTALRYLIDTVGVENVVLGTDYPADMASGDPVAEVQDNDLLTDDEKQALLSGNARRLLGR